MHIITIALTALMLISCAKNQPIKTYSKKIILKTKKLKFYDSSFVSVYDDYIHLEVFNSANIVLSLKVYKDKICKSAFKCVSSKKFNEEYLADGLRDDFLYNLLSKDKVSFEDKKRNILIKIF